MKKKCNVWLSLCYIPLGSQVILPNVKIRFPNGSSGAVFWPVTRVRVRVTVRAVVMSSTTWYQRRVESIVLTTDYKKSQRCYPPHGTMKKKCDVWLSLCYLPLASEAILPNDKIRFPNGSCFSFWGRHLARDQG